MKITAVRQTAPDETFSVEIPMNNKTAQGIHDEWSKVDAACTLLDGRMRERNMRYVEAVRFIERFPARYQAALKTMLDACLSGGASDLFAKVPELIPPDREKELQAEVEELRAFRDAHQDDNK